MTQPAADTLDREQGKLYVTDAELIRRLGVPERTARQVIPGLERRLGFPKKSVIFPGRRYWPEVKLWLDRHHGLIGKGEKS